jgi:hypothetical protein
MKPSSVLSGIVAAAAFAAAIVIPYLVHDRGSAAVTGWQAFVNPGAVSPSHQFLASRCESCHTPHVGVEAKTCINCHSTSAPFVAKPSLRFHLTAGDCRGCHIEHEGSGALVRMDHSALAALGYRQAPQTASSEDLQALVARVLEHLELRPSHTRSEAHLDCSTCHQNRDPHRGLLGSDCAACHSTAKWTIVGFRHPPQRANDCAQCHQAPPSHYKMHFEMVSKTVARQEHAKVEQCRLCHVTDSWNNIPGVGWYKHH